MATATLTATTNVDGTFTITSTGLKMVVTAPAIQTAPSTSTQDEWGRQLSNYVLGILYP
jgi:hypothetical protein